MVLAPLGKVFNEDNETGLKEEKDEEFIKYRKESSSKKGIVYSIKLEMKKTNQGEIRFWKSIKLWEKEKAIKLEKTWTIKEREREREVNARIFIKLWENTDSSKDTRDMRFHERSFKLRRMSKNEDSSRVKFNQIEEDEEKKMEDTFH